MMKRRNKLNKKNKLKNNKKLMIEKLIINSNMNKKDKKQINLLLLKNQIYIIIIHISSSKNIIIPSKIQIPKISMKNFNKNKKTT